MSQVIPRTVSCHIVKVSEAGTAQGNYIHADHVKRDMSDGNGGPSRCLQDLSDDTGGPSRILQDL